MAEIGQTPAEMVSRGIMAEEALGCTLCGLCERVCPVEISPKKMFLERRLEAIRNREYDIAPMHYLLPDAKQNLMTCYRDFFGIDYQDIVVREKAPVAFFPGCTMMTYAPGLTRVVFNELKRSCDCGGVLLECCGKPLQQIGLNSRFESLQKSLLVSIERFAIRTVIAACPGCYYELAAVLKPRGVALKTVYEAVGLTRMPHGMACTVHDSCPDRFDGVFAGQVRAELEKGGALLREMKRNRTETPCCGSGGHIIHFRPDLAEKHVVQRLREVALTEAEMLVGYCMSCVLQFTGGGGNIPVQHALNLLLGYEEDYGKVKEHVAEMFAGSEGERLWEQMMRGADSR